MRGHYGNVGPVPREMLFFVAVGILLTIVFGFAFVAAAKRLRRSRENLRKLAEQLRIQYDNGSESVLSGKPPSAAGEFHGRQIRVYPYVTGTGRTRVEWCAVSAALRNPAGLTLRISKENVLTRAGHTIGIDDVEVGDPAFDKRFYVKSDKPGLVRAALIPELREQIAAAWDAGARGTLSIDATEVKYAETGAFHQQKRCERFPRLAKLVCDIAEAGEACQG